jgi:hypothetical protein
MMERQRRNGRGVFDPDREQVETVDLQLVREQVVKWCRQGHLADADFDRRFPDACDADQLFVCGILDRGSSVLAQVWASGDKPEQRVSI